MDLSRRGFLRGRFRPVASQPRPPWATPELDFLSRCTRCNACLSACPTGVLRAGDGGYPTVDFATAECSFCGACADTCERGAIGRAHGAPWTLKARLDAQCLARRGVECRVCGEACTVGAIRFRPSVGGISLPRLAHEACTGCGACVAPCPVGAIAVEAPADPQPQPGSPRAQHGNPMECAR